MKESRSGRKIRRCAEKFYNDDLGLNINTHNITTFDLYDKVTSDVFTKDDGYVSYFSANDVTLQNVMRRGFSKPFIVRAETGKPPGLRVPDPGFTSKDVEELVGPTRKVDVMDVSTQRSLQMTMHQWAKYFESDNRDTLLNVISLEVSSTKLGDIVQPPTFVKEIDWVETAWPSALKNAQSVGCNSMSKMKYPKVQKYCLMSVRGSYTDFHLDFGGTSVWYHLVAGAKVFWLIPATEENLSRFVKWTLAGKQSDIFFGDLVEQCYRVSLAAGDTFYLPGGWIHAVYTPKKSVVFGGNFLHSYNIVGQLQVTAIEDITKVPPRYLYPYFVEMTWFVADNYHRQLKHVEHHGKGNAVLLECEVEGLNLMISRLEESETFQDSIPVQIANPKHLLQELRDLLLHAEIDTECGDYSEPLVSRDKNILSVQSEAPRKLHNMRLIATSRPFKVSPVVSSDSEEREESEESEESDVEILEDVISVIRSPSPLNNGKRRKLSPPRLSHSSPTGPSNFSSPEPSHSSPPELLRSISPELRPRPSYLSTYRIDTDSDTPVSPPKLSSTASKLAVHKKEHSTKEHSAKELSAKEHSAKEHSAEKERRLRSRKRRCGRCKRCTRTNCGQCKFCVDMRVFGGPGTRRQSCVQRRCEQVPANKQRLFNTEAEEKACVRCFNSQADRTRDPMLTCWTCSLTLHWACRDRVVHPPSQQELAVLWRWKCQPCTNKWLEARGKHMSLEVPCKSVAVPVTLAVPRSVAVPVTLQVPLTNPSSVPGNIFTKLAQPKEENPDVLCPPSSNIFTKFQPRVVLKDAKKSEMLKQVKSVLESNTLVSPSKIPIKGPSLVASQPLPRYHPSASHLDPPKTEPSCTSSQAGSKDYISFPGHMDSKRTAYSDNMLTQSMSCGPPALSGPVIVPLPACARGSAPPDKPVTTLTSSLNSPAQSDQLTPLPYSSTNQRASGTSSLDLASSVRNETVHKDESGEIADANGQSSQISNTVG